MDISLIVSLYRAQAFLAVFAHNVAQVAAGVTAAGMSCEIVLVANDPVPGEQAMLRGLKHDLESANIARVILLEVPRETLYASWNRGIQASSGSTIGNWNVDDSRTAAALVEGHALIEQGCSLVYFPWTLVRRYTVLGKFHFSRRVYRRALPFDRDHFSKIMTWGSFALFSRALYERIGPFDEHFRIAGDWAWYRRALDEVDFCAGTQLAGEFVLHGENLSSAENPLEVVENNIINLRHGTWDQIVPCQPDLMREAWETWGNQGIELPEELCLQLWGSQAAERWQTWLRDKRAHRRRVRISEILRAIPRFIINRTGLRPAFARLGLVKSASSER